MLQLVEFPKAVKPAVLVSMLIAPMAMCQTNAGISGTVAGDDGKPLPAVVTALRIGHPHATGRAQADAGGTFTIRNLPAGSYTLCATLAGSGYLDPCFWEPDHPIQLLPVNPSATTA
jgi:hypothetical protein